VEQPNAPQEMPIADLFADPAVQPSQSPVEQQASDQVATPVVEAPKPLPTVPLPELLEQRHARQLAEKEAQMLRDQLAFFQQRSAEAQRPQAPVIDPVADPEGAYRALVQRQDEQAINQRANMSEMLARRSAGDQTVDEAVQAAVKSGLNRHFMMQADPYGALLSWHNGQKVSQTVGTDLNAYREKVRQEVIAEMKAGKPVPQNLPPSLSTATNASRSAPVVQDANDFFKSMIARPQRST